MEPGIYEVGRVADEIRRLCDVTVADLEHLRMAEAVVDEPELGLLVPEQLGRIEKRLESIHEHTGELVRRVPPQLAESVAELRQAVIAKLRPVFSRNDSAGSVTDRLARLSQRERSIVRECVRSGLLTYEEIAQRLNVNPGSVKNVVNRLSRDYAKRGIFEKQQKEDGRVKIGVAKEVTDEIRRRTGVKLDPVKDPPGDSLIEKVLHAPVPALARPKPQE